MTNYQIIRGLIDKNEGLSMREILDAAALVGISSRKVKHVLHDGEYEGTLRLDWDRLYHTT